MGRAIGKNEEEVSVAMMLQIKNRCNPIEPPAISSDGNDSYPESMLETWGKSPEYAGRGRPLKSLREESNSDQRQWDPRSPAMAAGITDHIWTSDEMMMLLVVPESINA